MIEVFVMERSKEQEQQLAQKIHMIFSSTHDLKHKYKVNPLVVTKI